LLNKDKKKLMDNENIDLIAKKIISNFKFKYLNQKKLISRSYPITERTIFSNFDDVVPFFLFFGEEDFLVNQVKLLSSVSIESILAHKNLIYSFKIDEFIGGLYMLYKKTKHPVVKLTLDKGIEKILSWFFRENDLFGVFDIELKKTYPYRYYWSAGLLETFLEMADDYPELEQKSITVINNWLQSRYFKSNRLFPFRSRASIFGRSFENIMAKKEIFARFQAPNNNGKNIFSQTKYWAKTWVFHNIRSGAYTQIMKSNSTFIFSLTCIIHES